MRPTILILGMESNAGLEILRAGRLSKRNYRLIGLTDQSSNPHNFLCDSVYLVLKGDPLIDSLFRVIKIESPSLILSGRDDDLLTLSKLRPKLKKLGVACPVGSYKSVMACYDKFLTFKLMNRLNISFAETWLLKDFLTKSQSEFPYIVKPRKGNRSKEVAIAFCRDEIINLSKERNDLIVQKYLSDYSYIDAPQKKFFYDNGLLCQENEYSAQVIVGKNKKILGFFFSKNKLLDGIPVVVDVVNSEELHKSVFQVIGVMTELGLEGPCNLQAIETRPGYFEFFEFNSRCTGITGMRAEMGFNEIDAIYDHFVIGKNFEMAPVNSIYMGYKYWTNFITKKCKIAKLESNNFLKLK